MQYRTTLEGTEKVIQRRVSDAPYHAAEANDVHRDEDRVEENERHPEVDFPERVVQQAAKQLRKPEIETGKAAKERRREQRIVEMGHHEVGVVEIDVRLSRWF